ncbi:MAG: DegV family protein [Chloroflexi bacterium]|nr:DegV family protein [Chloroflexota bacterium]
MNTTDRPVKIVTDSSVHLPQAERQKHDITVVPLKAIFGRTVYRDEIDLTNQQFYDLLPNAEVHPTTSQPSAGEFMEVYKPFLDAGREIVSIHLPSKLSGTYASACAAKTELESQLKKALPLSIVDTPWLSMALGMLVLAAAEAAEAGKSREEVLATINALIPKLNLIFVLDTLEYLKRGGRIGGARAMLGTLLNVKPMLEIKHGQVEPLEQPRSRAKALKRLLEIMDERTGHKPVHVSILHAVSPVDAAEIEKELRKQFELKEFYMTEIGAVIGVHTGPNALGLAFYAD